jgi:hypothetical protein
LIRGISITRSQSRIRVVVPYPGRFQAIAKAAAFSGCKLAQKAPRGGSRDPECERSGYFARGIDIGFELSDDSASCWLRPVRAVTTFAVESGSGALSSPHRRSLAQRSPRRAYPSANPKHLRGNPDSSIIVWLQMMELRATCRDKCRLADGFLRVGTFGLCTDLPAS